MLVPKYLEQVCTEGTPPHLVSLLFRFLVCRLQKRVVSDDCVPVHPAALMHPFFVDLLHDVFGEHGVGGCLWFSAKVWCSLDLDDIQEGLQISSLGNEAPAS